MAPHRPSGASVLLLAAFQLLLLATPFPSASSFQLQSLNTESVSPSLPTAHSPTPPAALPRRWTRQGRRAAAAYSRKSGAPAFLQWVAAPTRARPTRALLSTAQVDLPAPAALPVAASGEIHTPVERNAGDPPPVPPRGAAPCRFLNLAGSATGNAPANDDCHHTRRPHLANSHANASNIRRKSTATGTPLTTNPRVGTFPHAQNRAPMKNNKLISQTVKHASLLALEPAGKFRDNLNNQQNAKKEITQPHSHAPWSNANSFASYQPLRSHDAVIDESTSNPNLQLQPHPSFRNSSPGAFAVAAGYGSSPAHFPRRVNGLLSLTPKALAGKLKGSGRARLVWRVLRDGGDPWEMGQAALCRNFSFSSLLSRLLLHAFQRPPYSVQRAHTNREGSLSVTINLADGKKTTMYIRPPLQRGPCGPSAAKHQTEAEAVVSSAAACDGSAFNSHGPAAQAFEGPACLRRGPAYSTLFAATRTDCSSGCGSSWKCECTRRMLTCDELLGQLWLGRKLVRLTKRPPIDAVAFAEAEDAVPAVKQAEDSLIDHPFGFHIPASKLQVISLGRHANLLATLTETRYRHLSFSQVLKLPNHLPYLF
eukprot:GHVT01045798.1.p1 GENE.GHVT01045798.1~~GHVT01045798.1.p1  ORF type:complete len:595 (+),score=88.14 GHVT01045798.1:274-2058(+)